VREIEHRIYFYESRSGYICIGMPGERLDELDIPMMVPDNQERHRTAYTVTVDYKHGTSSYFTLYVRPRP
jgi:3,4-dihydroxy 2-butanone 4-phosphate synthase